MNKVGMLFVLAVVVLAVGVFAESDDIKEDIRDFVKERGIEVGAENITEIDFDDLPGELDIDRIRNTSIAIYQVDYDEAKPLFVVTASDVRQSVPEMVAADVRMLFVFGGVDERSENGFLDMASGVEGSLTRGYVMMREGSITGISSNLDVVGEADGGIVEIIIYKNGEEVGFRNMLNAGKSGVGIDYDSLSKGVVSVEAGDVISVYVSLENGASVRDVTTMIEVTS